MSAMGRLLILSGVVLIICGALFLFIGRFPGMRRLPGDILIQRDQFTFYFPITTSILISVVLSFIMWLFLKR